MSRYFYLIALFFLIAIMKSQTTNFNRLTDEEKRVILYRGTERPFTGLYNNFNQKGTYICKQCNAPLFKSEHKFHSTCGWPSFDDQIEGAILRLPDADGHRIEIVCANCKGHLGHVFEGEGFTAKNIRHCVNSISLKFIPENEPLPKVIKVPGKTEIAYFASGCFWGTEYYFQRAEGVINTSVGYMGGTKTNPTYQDVCTGTTGHAETVRVEFSPEITNYEILTKLFFETHDPTQLNKQGPDVGTQYRSAIFYIDENQRAIAEKLKQLLLNKGIPVVTEITPATDFWPAENYHQKYYDKKGGRPYCHFKRKLF